MLHIGFTGTQHGLTEGQHAALEAHMNGACRKETEGVVDELLGLDSSVGGPGVEE